MENQATMEGMTNGDGDEKESRRRSPLERELSATRRIVQILGELSSAGAQERVLSHVSSYMSSLVPVTQEELPL